MDIPWGHSVVEFVRGPIELSNLPDDGESAQPATGIENAVNKIAPDAMRPIEMLPIILPTESEFEPQVQLNSAPCRGGNDASEVCIAQIGNRIAPAMKVEWVL